MSVERVVIDSRAPYAVPFSTDLKFEEVHATAYFVLDPTRESNARITDLPLATDGDGLVRYSANLVLVAPTSSDQPGTLLYVVANRGRTDRMPLDLAHTGTPARGSAVACGDGFALRNGCSVLWCGWQWDIESTPRSVRLAPPVAQIDGEAPEGQLEIQIEVAEKTSSHVLVDTGTSGRGTLAYPARPSGPATLTRRARSSPNAELVPPSEWQFGRDDGAEAVFDPNFLTIAGGFDPGYVYTFRYQPDLCPVNGVGLLVARDVASMMRYDRAASMHDAAPPISKAIALGTSQSGRYLREFLYQGLNQDEQGRQVFDAMLIDVASARRGEFNERYGQLSTNRNEGVGLEPPYSAEHKLGGLLDRQRAVGSVPKVILVNTAWEYWRRDGSALHIERDGSADLAEVDGVREYLVAGASHVLGNGASDARLPPANPSSTIDRVPVLRALYLALLRWVDDEALPPASRVPRLAERTAVEREGVLATLARIPGLELPELSVFPATSLSHPGQERLYFPTGVPPEDRLSVLVSAVDMDGNETAGVLLPEVGTPIATHLGFNPRARIDAAPAPLVELIGTSFPFAASESKRRANHDPRQSLEERYSSREDYRGELEKCARALVDQGFMLDDDVALVVERALARYDTLLGV